MVDPAPTLGPSLTEGPTLTLGLWPLAGITTIGVRPGDAASTISAAIDAGIRSFDTAFSYGYNGESDRHLGQVIAPDREHYWVMGKVGQRWTPDGKRVTDGRPEQLIADAEASLQRMGIEAFDLLYLHCPDPQVPLGQSADALESLRQRGLCRHLGVCNVTVQQYRSFGQSARCDAVQCPLNLLQRDSLDELIPACASQGTQVFVFWTLMKGLLAGKISRDHQFASGDSRPGYAVFQGEARERAHRIVDRLETLGTAHGLTVSQLAVGWVLSQNGVTGALVGARRPDQIRELALAKRLTADLLAEVNTVIDLDS